MNILCFFNFEDGCWFVVVSYELFVSVGIRVSTYCLRPFSLFYKPKRIGSHRKRKWTCERFFRNHCRAMGTCSVVSSMGTALTSETPRPISHRYNLLQMMTPACTNHRCGHWRRSGSYKSMTKSYGPCVRCKN